MRELTMNTSYENRNWGNNSYCGFLYLLGCALVASMPFYFVESFRPVEHSVSSFVATTAFANSPKSRILAPIRKIGTSQRLQCYQISKRTLTSTSPTLLSAHSLTTALERLWDDRIASYSEDMKEDYQYLSWLDLESENSDVPSAKTNTTRVSADDSVTLPLYPLSEVYLPQSTRFGTIVNHTLNNVEPQNIKMALDLLSESSPSPRFCVVLRTIDTGRIANVGTILRIIDSDIQKIPEATYDFDPVDSNKASEKISRIVLTCHSEGLAEILDVENGSGWAAKRILRDDEYLRAKVRPLTMSESSENNAIETMDSWQDVYNTIREDIRTIKLIYQIQLGREAYPREMLFRLGNEMQDFPELDDSTENGETLLWNLVQEWQSVCMTLRHGRQGMLSGDRNELMIDARDRMGGPRKLPILLSDIDPESRLEVQKLDMRFQKEHELSNMDPTLDFQVLIGLPTTKRRFDFLARLVARERSRLEALASSYSSPQID